MRANRMETWTENRRSSLTLAQPAPGYIRDGDLFLFLNRRGDRIKSMYWDRDGIAIWMKRLEQGTFQRPLASAASGGISQVEIDATDLSLLLSGIDLNSAKRRQRYVAGASQQSQSRIAETK